MTDMERNSNRNRKDKESEETTEREIGADIE